MLKRVGLLVLTNLAILVVLGVVLAVLQGTGILGDLRGYGPLLVIAAVFGFGGSFISLALSKRIAKWTTGARVIEHPTSQGEAWLVQTVRRLAAQAGIGMPEVAVYDSPDPNAFATGMSRNKALVAVSTGLLRRMEPDEVEGVLGHEMAHVANGDMVTLTLIQGVLNTFVIFLSRVIGGVVDGALSGGREHRGPGIGYFVTTIVAQIVLGILASIIVMWFSRYREFRADAGGATLAGREKMIGALEKLRRAHEPSHLPDSMTAFGIRSGGTGFMSLFRSHPPIEERIARLRGTAGRQARFDRVARI